MCIRDRHERGRRDAAGRRQGRLPDRGGGNPRDPGGVPGPGPVGDGQHVPDPASGGWRAGGRQGCLTAVPPADLQPPARRARAGRPARPGRGPGVDGGGADVLRPRRRLRRRPGDARARLREEPLPVIDFRYHLVSLVSVFMALAIGVVLGAGPLKEAIGDTLSNQVAELRADTEDLTQAVENREVQIADRDAFIESVTDPLLAEQLGGTSVVLITLPGADSDVADALGEQLAASGAT